MQVTKGEPVPMYMTRWARGREEINTEKANTYFACGGRGGGKSCLMEVLGTHHHALGGTIIDLYGSQDCESLGWCRSGYEKVLLIGDENIDVKSSWDYMHISEFNLSIIPKYDVITTIPPFYSTEAHENQALTKMIDSFYKRRSWGASDYVLIREAWKFIYSRIRMGENGEQAKAAFIKFCKEARHSGFAAGVDTQRPTSIDVDVRQLADYTFLKQLGLIQLPDEFRFVYSLIQPAYIQRLPVDKFVVICKSGAVGIGGSLFPPFHKKEHEDLFADLGIVVDAGDPPELSTTKLQNIRKERKRLVDEALHRKIVSLRDQGLSHTEIIIELKRLKLVQGISRVTIGIELQEHNGKVCCCYSGGGEVVVDARAASPVDAGPI